MGPALRAVWAQDGVWLRGRLAWEPVCRMETTREATRVEVERTEPAYGPAALLGLAGAVVAGVSVRALVESPRSIDECPAGTEECMASQSRTVALGAAGIVVGTVAVVAGVIAAARRPTEEVVDEEPVPSGAHARLGDPIPCRPSAPRDVGVLVRRGSGAATHGRSGAAGEVNVVAEGDGPLSIVLEDVPADLADVLHVGDVVGSVATQ